MGPLKIVVLGLSITSSWGNGHATTYRALVRELDRLGHDVLFLERDVPWYASNRDLPRPPYGRTELYAGLPDLAARFAGDVKDADAVIVGSYVPEGVEVIRWAQATARGPTMFYDIDTPVTLAKLERGDHEYVSPDVIPGFAAYLSFTGGPTLDLIERRYRARHAWPLYCSVDPEDYHPEAREPDLDLGYLGTYSLDRQPALERLLLEPARRWPEGRFAVAGPQYPPGIRWPSNVERRDHLPPAEHRAFYNRQRFTLNVTREDMVKAGWSPSVRLFEAAACGTPILSDWWEGLDHFFEPGRSILVAKDADESLRALRETSEDERRKLGERARERVLKAHTAAHRAKELEGYVRALRQEAVPHG